jgi:hypothetical protein
MTAASAEQVGALAIGSLLLTTGLVVAAVVVAVRALKRRWRRVRVTLMHRAASSVELVGNPLWWSAQRTRRRMWRALADAERAVRAAQRVDAPVGELPLLSRQLHGSARLVDAQLRSAAATGAPASPEVAAQVRDVMRAAAEINAAVSSAITETVQPQLAPLLAAVGREAAALSAGTRAARRIG